MRGGVVEPVDFLLMPTIHPPVNNHKTKQNFIELLLNPAGNIPETSCFFATD